MRFCGFILIFDNMSISQLEIDKSEWAVESGLLDFWERCKRGDKASQSATPRPTNVPNVRPVKRLHPNHIHHSHSIVVQAVQTLALQSLQALAGGPVSP